MRYGGDAVTAQNDDDASRRGPELFFALVYPVGTDADLVFNVLSDGLADLSYRSQELHLIELLTGEPSRHVFDRYSKRMDAGNEFRKDFGSPDNRQDAFALYAAAAVLSNRNKKLADKAFLERVLQRHAYVIRSLKRREEVDTLRTIYGDALIVIAAHSPRKSRRDRLTWEIAKSDASTAISASHRPEAESLISRDEREADDQFGQRVSDTVSVGRRICRCARSGKSERVDREILEASLWVPVCNANARRVRNVSRTGCGATVRRSISPSGSCHRE